MFQMKHFVVLVLPLMVLSSVAAVSAAQDQPTESAALFAPELKLPSSSGRFVMDAATDAPPSTGYVRTAPTTSNVKKDAPIRPFRSLAVGFNANSLGAGVELATPVSRSFNLRSSVNVFAFNYPFSIDGVNYDARLHLKSSGTTLDWFPWHRGFHISPGILYVKNTLSSGTSVGPGQTFELGSQTFINSVDDPVSGSASVVFPRKVAPMLLVGFGNLIPRSGKRLSFPVEFGAAYTGAAEINVLLDGTACSQQGCVSFAQNQGAQGNLKDEIYKLNEDLKRVPVYPVFSMGVAYHF
jgi:hypothetical protein